MTVARNAIDSYNINSSHPTPTKNPGQHTHQFSVSQSFAGKPLRVVSHGTRKRILFFSDSLHTLPPVITSAICTRHSLPAWNYLAVKAASPRTQFRETPRHRHPHSFSAVSSYGHSPRRRRAYLHYLLAAVDGKGRI